jgi:hypothetical protein
MSVLFALLVLLSGGLFAQGFAPDAGTLLEQPVDVAQLEASGWTEASSGFWVREVRPGTVQKLAFGAGRLEMVPELQAELTRLVERIAVEPSEKLFGAIDRLTGTLAAIHGAGPTLPNGGQTKAALAPPGCYPLHLTTSMFTFASSPPGWHGIDATASASWDGDGYPCEGHVYTRAEYQLTSLSQGNLYDLDWCADSDAYAGSCWAGVDDPWYLDYTSCHTEAYAYLTVANGAVVMSETKESNVC